MTTATLLRRFDRWAMPALAALAAGLLLAETRWPLRRRTRPRRERWPRNVGVAAPAAAGMRLVLLPAMAALAQLSTRRRFGPLHHSALPQPLRLLLELLMLDYLAYTWHRLLHAPLLWRLHRVHHIDLDMDLSTAWRFHAGEMLASVPYRAGLPALLGVRPGVVLAYETVFEACTAFHHSNWRLPLAVERGVVRLLVTPRTHGIHHSVVHRETQSNFGVVLTLWDRLHRTLRLNVPQVQVEIGVPAFDPTEVAALPVGALLRLPLVPLRPWARPDGSRPDRSPQPQAPMVLAG